MQKVKIYTDGACSGNPGKGGYAAIIIYKENIKEVVGSKEYTTNNQMELLAAIKGMEALKTSCEVELYTDSAYLVNAYEKNWIKNWIKNNWKTSTKKEVKNIDLWKRLEKLGEIHKIKYIKVKGHSDNEYNNKCDKLAVEAYKKINNKEFKHFT